LREISDEADAPLESVGQDLRKARQRKGEDLAQISRMLKIRKAHLDAIEESHFDSLPGRAYVIGFVRGYAEYLGLDQAACVERVKIEMAGRNDARESTVNLTLPRERKLPQGSVIFVIVLLIAVVYGGYYLFSAAHRMAGQPVTPVPDRLAAQAGLKPPPPPSTVAAPSAAAESAAPASAPPAAAPSPPAVVPPPGTLATSPNAAAADTLPQGQKYGLQNKGSRITLKVHKTVRVVVQNPAHTIFISRDLQPGDTYQVPNLTGLTLATPDGGALEVVLDGSSLGYIGKGGAAVDAASLNPQDLIDHKGQ
jgi:cytoskeleton protein RodZ